MKIRSITYFTNPGWPILAGSIEQATAFLPAARSAFEEAGFEVQTVRLATPPFPTLLPDCNPDRVMDFAQELEELSTGLGFDYLSIGPALPSHPDSYAAIPEVIAATQLNLCFGGDGRARKRDLPGSREGLCGRHPGSKRPGSQRVRQPVFRGPGERASRRALLPGGLP